MLTLKSIILPILFSFFLYCEYFQISVYLLNTLAALATIYLLFTLTKKELFLSGFGVGILWFWWLGYSFVYYDLIYLIPIVIISIGILYGILFTIIGLSNNPFYKVSYIFVLSFIEPFSFNWFKLELLFINSYIGISKYELFAVLFFTALLFFLKNKNRFNIAIFAYIVAVIFLVVFKYLNLNLFKEESSLKIYMNETNIDQDIKWNSLYLNKILDQNFKNINSAIKNGYDLIIFPETSYPLVLNNEENIMGFLLEKSNKISIILGSLYEKDGLYYNSTYFFEKGVMQVAHKVVLVPFGEAVPLPEKIRDFINDLFYNGAKDYETAKEPTTFNIKGTKFRNAICYEATTDKIYESLDTKYVIATSNNAWFTPSIQPTLQKLLLKYYSKKYDLTIYSVTNKSKSGIIK